MTAHVCVIITVLPMTGIGKPKFICVWPQWVVMHTFIFDLVLRPKEVGVVNEVNVSSVSAHQKCCQETKRVKIYGVRIDKLLVVYR
jgi:hypothetical protein